MKPVWLEGRCDRRAQKSTQGDGEVPQKSRGCLALPFAGLLGLGCAPSPSRLVVKSSGRHCRIRLSCDSRIDCGVIVVLTLGLSEDATLCHNPRPAATERTRESKGARAILMIATLYSPVTNPPSRGSGTKRNDLRLMAPARGMQHSHLPNSADAAVRFSCQQGPRRCQPAHEG